MSSSRSHNTYKCTFVRLAQLWLEPSIFIILAQVSLRPFLALSLRVLALWPYQKEQPRILSLVDEHHVRKCSVSGEHVRRLPAYPDPELRRVPAGTGHSSRGGHTKREAQVCIDTSRNWRILKWSKNRKEVLEVLEIGSRPIFFWKIYSRNAYEW